MRNVAVLENIHLRFELSIHLSVKLFSRTNHELSSHELLKTVRGKKNIYRKRYGKFKTQLDAF